MKKNKLELIKKIRQLTNISIQKCKEILEKNNFNLKESLKNIKKIKIKIKKKSKEGIIINKIKNKKAVMLKIICETDFTSKNIEFKNFSNEIINFCIKKNIFSLKKINNHFNKKINEITLKFKENIFIKNICNLKGTFLGKYIHNNNKLGCILKIDTNNNNIKYKYIKQICMQISAMNPKYIDINSIKNKNIKEYNINKLNKNILLEQNFIFNDKILIKNFLKEKNIKIINFYRYEI